MARGCLAPITSSTVTTFCYENCFTVNIGVMRYAQVQCASDIVSYHKTVLVSLLH